MNVVPATSQSAPAAVAACPNCGAALAEDQRYCLACGRPCSPVRLAFLDVLQGEGGAQSAAGWYASSGGQAVGLVSSSPALPVGPPLPPVPGTPYGMPPEQGGFLGGLRRYSGLMGLLALLLVAGLIGLLVGHWASGSSTPNTLKIVYPNGVPAAAAAAPAASSTGSSATGSSSSGSSKAAGGEHESVAEEEKEVKEAETKKPLPAPVKASPKAVNELNNTTGKKHREAVNKLLEKNPTAPVETG